MRTKVIGFFTLLLANIILLGNGVTISDLDLVNQDAANDFNFVKFKINWENSWHTNSAPANNDAVWVFVKYHGIFMYSHYLPYLQGFSLEEKNKKKACI